MKSIAKLTLALVVLVATTAAAQNSANITATANVQQPITVTAGNNLNFANVFPGVNKTVLVSDAGAGTFTIAGQATTPVTLAMTIPATLSDGATHTLTIGSWTGYENASNSPTAGGTAFTPVSGTIPGTLTLSGGGAGFIFVGATVSPTIAQVAGTYTGTVSLTVTY